MLRLEISIKEKTGAFLSAFFYVLSNSRMRIHSSLFSSYYSEIPPSHQFHPFPTPIRLQSYTPLHSPSASTPLCWTPTPLSPANLVPATRHTRME
ncbi:hypothetical protein K439DRAFT_601631 [Ramaria rubella]|nr:hypothetical protein K439DRAFT_601631 [Ramaria rubella]